VNTARKTISDTKGEAYQAQGDTKHVPVVMHEDVARFYGRLSAQGRHVLARLISSAPAADTSCGTSRFRIVVSSLARMAGCSRLSVLRNLPKGEKAGLFQRETDSRGPRHGSIVTLFLERCELFLTLYRRQYALLPGGTPDTSHERYQSPVIGIRQDDPIAALASNLSEPAFRLFRELFRLPSAQGNLTLSVQALARTVGASQTTARRSLKRGQAVGLFTRSSHPRGPRHGTVLELHPEPCRRFQQLMSEWNSKATCSPDTSHERSQARPVTGPDRYQGQGVTNHERYEENAKTHCNQRDFRESIPSSDTNGDRYQLPLLDRKNKNLSILPEDIQEDDLEQRVARHLTGISLDEFQIVWPRLEAGGFGPAQVRQIVRHRLELGRTVRDLENSLHAVEFELTNGTFPETRKGVCNYVFGTLKLGGTWRRPQGFEAPEDRALRLAQEAEEKRLELERIQNDAKREKQRESLENSFESWLETLTEEERDRIASQAPVHVSSEMARRQWFKSYWRRSREVVA
jgi:DNA-binding MarR family transcriptional regulator